MAVFDPESGKLVVRIVYDGLALAGKTTNVEQLCGFFGSRRRGELYTPATELGRTAYFDWLRLDAGLVMGRGLRCHLITVPGQGRHARRRRRLLALADVVVFVCDSRPSEARKARRRFRALQRRVEAPDRLMLQANKQDMPSALSAEELVALLGADERTQVVPAQAAAGLGVRETAVLAIRAAADLAQQLVLEDGIESLSTEVLGAKRLYEAMRADEREGALHGSVLELDSTAEEEHQLAELRAPSPALADTTPIDSEPPEDDEGSRSTLVSAGVTAAAKVEQQPEATKERPVLPSNEVPSGFIWPGVRGRHVISSLELSRLRERRDLVAQPGRRDGSGRPDAHVYELSPWCMKTSARRRYEDHETARAALAHLARAKVSLGPMLLDDTVLALAHSDGGTWLWTIAPWVDTVRARLEKAHGHGDADALRAELRRYADAAVAALRLTLRRGVVLDIHPSNFAVQDGVTRYIDDDIVVGSRLPMFGHSVLQRLVEYRDAPEALEAYVARLVDSLATETGLQGDAREHLLESFERAQSGSKVFQQARERIVQSLRRRGR